MLIAAILLLFLLSAFFSSAETVLFSLTGAQRARIRERSRSADRRIARCLSDKAVLFSTILVGNTFVNFALSTLGYYVFARWIPGCGWVAIPVMTALLLVFGEITPKRLALKYTEEIAPLVAQLIWFWRAVLSPFNAVLRLTSRAMISLPIAACTGILNWCGGIVSASALHIWSPRARALSRWTIVANASTVSPFRRMSIFTMSDTW